MKKCPRCRETKPNEEFYTRRGTQTHSYCKPCVNQQTKDRQRNLKKLAVEYKGGCCEACGGKFHPACYDFHHKDVENKDFSIGKAKCLKFEKVKEELDKCSLLCSNCHRVIHARY